MLALFHFPSGLLDSGPRHEPPSSPQAVSVQALLQLLECQVAEFLKGERYLKLTMDVALQPFGPYCRTHSSGGQDFTTTIDA